MAGRGAEGDPSVAGRTSRGRPIGVAPGSWRVVVGCGVEAGSWAPLVIRGESPEAPLLFDFVVRDQDVLPGLTGVLP